MARNTGLFQLPSEIVNQPASQPQPPSLHPSLPITSGVASLENHVPFAFTWPTFPGFVTGVPLRQRRPAGGTVFKLIVGERLDRRAVRPHEVEISVWLWIASERLFIFKTASGARKTNPLAIR